MNKDLLCRDKCGSRSERGPPSSLTWTSCLPPGPSDGPDLFGPQQRVLRVHVPPQSGRQKEAADSVRDVGRWTLLRLGPEDLPIRCHLLPGCCTGVTGQDIPHNYRFTFSSVSRC